MKRFICLLALSICAIGCKNTIGPLENKKRSGPDPLLSIDEQKRYGSGRYSYIEDTNLVPRGFADRPSPTGR